LYSFKEYLNEINIKGKALSKPLWNGEDYLDRGGDINLDRLELKELPCVFPEKWNKNFYCSSNNLTSLEGVPKEIGGSFYCGINNLTTLKGSPEKVDGGFWCNHNHLTSLEGAPKEVSGVFGCNNNSTKFTEEDVKKVCKVGGGIIV